jgi:hypothetical protein
MSEFDPEAVVRWAQTVVYREKLQVLTERAVQSLAGTPGLAYTRLLARSRVIYVVTYNGQLLGRARLEHPQAPDAGWVAVPDRGRPLGRYPEVRAAARALAEAAGLADGRPADRAGVAPPARSGPRRPGRASGDHAGGSDDRAGAR